MLGWFVVTTIFAGTLSLLACLVIRLWRPSAALQHGLWLLILLKMMTPSCVAWPWSPWNWLVATPPAAQRAPALHFGAALHAPPMTEAMDRVPLDLGPQGSAMEIAEREAGAPDATIDPPSVRALHAPGAKRSAASLVSGLLFSASQQLSGPIEALGGRARSARTSLSTDPTVFNDPPAASAPRLAGLADWPWKDMLVALWLAGTTAVLARNALRIAAIERHCWRAASASESVAVHVAQIARRMRLKTPRVLVSQQARYPFLWCLGSPRLIWPAYLNFGGLTPGREAVLAHELAHLVRKDHLVAWLLLGAECLWWWNPLFYFVRTRLRDSAEQACDAWAIWAVPAARKSFAAALIDISAAIPWERPFAPALGVSGARRHSFERRLTMIVQGRQRHRLGPLATVALAATGMITLPGWSTGQEAERPRATSSASSQQGEQRGAAAARSPVEFTQPAASAHSMSSGTGAQFAQASTGSAPAQGHSPIPPVLPTTPQPGPTPTPPASMLPAEPGVAEVGAVNTSAARHPGELPGVEVRPPVSVTPGTASLSDLPRAVSEKAILRKPLTIRVFRLAHQRAERMKAIVEHVLRVPSGEQGTQEIRLSTANLGRPSSNSPKVWAQQQAVVALMSNYLLPDGTRLVVDGPRNALVARAPEETMAKIASIVQAFDVLQGQAIKEISSLPGVQVLIYRTGTADGWLEILSNLGLDIQVIWRDDEAVFVDGPYGTHREGGAYEGTPYGTRTQRGGSIIIAGDPETLRQASYVVRELDNGEGQPARGPGAQDGYGEPVQR